MRSILNGLLALALAAPPLALAQLQPIDDSDPGHNLITAFAHARLAENSDDVDDEDAIRGLLALPETPDVIAFIGVSVIPMHDDRVMPDQTVIVRDGRVTLIGQRAELDVPADALVIDGHGRYLIPGLAEMHAHIPSPQQGEGALDRTLVLFLANGVTTIRGMLGHPSHLDLRARSEAGEILAPRVFTSSPSLNGNSAPDPETGRRLVEEHHAAGYDFLKIHPGLSRETYDAIVATASELGMAWAGHVPADVGLYRALDAGQITIDHLDAYVEALAGYGDGFSGQDTGFFGIRMIDEVDLRLLFGRSVHTAEAGVWNVPTQSLMEHVFSPDDPDDMVNWPEMRYIPPETLTRWAAAKRSISAQAETPERAARFLEVRREIIAALQEVGAPLLLGADAPQIFNVPGFSTLRELQYLVEAGLTPYEALVTGTRNPAAYLRGEDWGTIGPGNWADLVLLDQNPLDEIGNASTIHGVMVRGHWLPRAEIDARLALIEEAVRE